MENVIEKDNKVPPFIDIFDQHKKKEVYVHY